MSSVPVDLGRVTVVAEGIRGEFTAMLKELPGGLRNVSALSRHLEVPRPVCQRLISGIRRATDPVELLLALPGVKGLEQVVEAAKARGGDAAAIARAELAVARYAELIDQHGGSQAKLNAAIRGAQFAPTRAPVSFSEPGRGPGPLGDEDHRRQIFEAARAICDRWCECKFKVWILGPGRAGPGSRENVAAYGFHGVHRGPRAAPLCLTVQHAADQDPLTVPTPVPVRDLNEHAAMHGHSPRAILEPFCSRPLPRVVSQTRGADVDQFIEFEPDASGRGTDVVLADRFIPVPHASITRPPLLNCTLFAEAPPKRLVITTYLHRTLARDCVASAGCYLPGLRGSVGSRMRSSGLLEARAPSERWFDRVPQRQSVEYLGPGPEAADSPAYPRMRELCEAMFAAGTGGGWDPSEFVGFRVSVDYPVWNAEYVLTLDLTPLETATEAGEAEPD